MRVFTRCLSVILFPGWVVAQSISISPPQPASLNIDTSGTGAVVFSVPYTLSGFSPTPDGEDFYWIFQDPFNPSLRWNGTAWTSDLLSGPVETTSPAFWAGGSVGTSSVQFSATADLFTQAFWGGATSRTVSVSLVVQPNGGSQWNSNSQTLNFIDTTPPVLTVDPLSATSFNFSPGQTNGVSFYANYNVTHGGGGQLQWGWQDTGDNTWWDGLNWQASPVYLGTGSTHGWQGTVTNNGSRVTADLDIPTQADLFWSGSDRQIQLRFVWSLSGQATQASYQPTLDLQWSTLPAPMLLSETGTVYSPNATIQWRDIPEASHTRIMLFEAGTFSQAIFDIQSALIHNNSHGVTLNQAGVTYEIWMRSGNETHPTVNVGSLTHIAPDLVHGAAQPTNLDVHFDTNALETFTLYFQNNNFPDFDSANLQWSLQKQVGGTTHYLTRNSSTGQPYWTTTPDAQNPAWNWVDRLDGLFPTQTVFADRIETSFRATDLGFDFWTGGSGYADQTITCHLQYAGNPDIPFTGPPPTISFQRVGNPPQAPATLGGIAAGGTLVIDDRFPEFQWAAASGAFQYHASVSGDFATTGGQQTYDNTAAYCHDLSLAQFRVKDAPIQCLWIPLDYGQNYSLTLRSENPVGVSADATWTVQVEPPIVFTQPTPGSHDTYEVVENCDLPLSFDYGIDSIGSSFDSDNLLVYIKRDLSEGWWDGTYWQSERVGFPITHLEGFWNSIAIDTAQSKLTLDFQQSDFGEQFWKVAGYGGAGNDGGYGEPGHLYTLELDYRSFANTQTYQQQLVSHRLLFNRLRVDPPVRTNFSCWLNTGTEWGNYDPADEQFHFQWQAVDFADSYEVFFEVFQGDEFISALATPSVQVGAAEFAIPVADLDPTLEYRLSVITLVNNCPSEKTVIHGPFQYIDPGLPYGSHLPLTITDPEIPQGELFLWDYAPNPDLGATPRHILNEMEFDSVLDDPDFNYETHCNQLGWYTAIQISYLTDHFPTPEDCDEPTEFLSKAALVTEDGQLVELETEPIPADPGNHRITLYTLFMPRDHLDPDFMRDPGTTNRFIYPFTKQFMEILETEGERVCMDWRNEIYYLKVIYGIAQNYPFLGFPAIGQSDDLVFKLNPINNQPISFNLGEAEPNHATVDGVAPSSASPDVDFLLPFEYELQDEDKIFVPDGQRLGLLVKATNRNQEWDPQEDYYWKDGIWQTLAGRDLNDPTDLADLMLTFGNLNESPDPFSSDIDLEWDQAKIRAKIADAQFDDGMDALHSFLPPLPEGSEAGCDSFRIVEFQLVWSGDPETPVEAPNVLSNPATFTVFRDIPVQVTGLDLGEPNPGTVPVVPRRLGTMANFQVPLDVTKACPDLPAHPQVQDFVWSLRAEMAALFFYWDGSDWVSLGSAPEPTDGAYPFANNDAFQGPEFYAHVSLHLDPFAEEGSQDRIQAQIPANLFTIPFFAIAPIPDQMNNLEMVLTYQPDEGDPITVTNSINIHRFPDTGGLDWDNLMSFVRDCPHVIGAYPPEPMLLEDEKSYWKIGSEINNFSGNFGAGDPLTNPGLFTWLHLKPDPAISGQVELLAFITPYPSARDGEGLFKFETRTATEIDLADRDNFTDSWATTGNLAYSYFRGDGRPDRLVAVIFVSDQVSIPTGSLAPATNPAAGSPNNISAATLLNTVDPDHNRSLTMAYLDETSTGDSRVLYQVRFTDQLGRTQQVHAAGSHDPPELQDKMLVSGVVSYDALGREKRGVKGFYQDLPVDLQQLHQAFGQAGLRADTYAGAQYFWSPANDNKRTLPGATQAYAAGDPEPYGETVYEQDARGRPIANLGLGEVSHQWADLRYLRNHYFVVPAPSLNWTFKLDGADISPTFFNLHQTSPQTPFGSGTPLLSGILAIDPNGTAVATFTGIDPEVVLLTLSNPEVALIEAWGFQVNNEGPYPQQAEDLVNEIVYLPSDYEDRIQETEGRSENLAAYHYVDRLGRLRASFPPKSITVTPGTNSWAIQKVFDLHTTYLYNRFDQPETMVEPDAGITRSHFDNLGQLRFSQNANQEAHDRWTEWVYDDLGREAQVHEIQAADPTIYLDLPASGLPSLPNSLVETQHDQYGTEVSPPGFVSYWPKVGGSNDTLKRTNPYWDTSLTEGIVFSAPTGLIAQVTGPFKAERLYYDQKGRPACKVTLYRDLAEPQIAWTQYNRNDQVTSVTDVNANQAYQFIYDAWDRLIRVEDRTPRPIRMKLQAASSAADQSYQLTGDTHFGPLKNASEQTAGSATLAEYSHTPTGHVARTLYHDQSLQTQQYFDVRDWLLRAETHRDGQLVYQSQLGYFGSGGNPTAPLYNGTVTRVAETYGHSLANLADATNGMVHDYTYDAGYQLIGASSQWDGANDPVTHSYDYDRNGNRQWETRDTRGADATVSTGLTDFSHDIDDVSNKLLSVTKDGATEPNHLVMTYDPMGNVETITKWDEQGNRMEQIFHYEDPVNRQLPTRIEQSAFDTQELELAELKMDMEVTYDHGGTRIKRQTTRYEELEGNLLPLRPETTHYLPSGTENQAELDRLGRTQRAYLFAGEGRIGFKSADATAFYITDHLGSTKVTAAVAGVPQANLQELPPTSDLLGHWPLDDSYDNQISSGTPAVPQSAPIFVDSPRGKAISLDGSGDYLDLNQTDLGQNIGDLSISLWAKLGESLGGVNRNYHMVSNQASGSEGYRIRLLNKVDPTEAGGIHFTTFASTGSVTVNSGAQTWPDDGDWHHLAVTKSGDTGKIYLDGQLVGTQSGMPDPGDATYSMKLGAIGDGSGSFWIGELDAVRFYDRALDETEIATATQEEGESFTGPQPGEWYLMLASDTDPYGNTLRELYDPTVDQGDREPHGFTGQEKEPDLGLYYYGARWYMPDVGRFLQVDSKREFWNTYSYVGNKPLNNIDPDGDAIFEINDKETKAKVQSAVYSLPGPIGDFVRESNVIIRISAGPTNLGHRGGATYTQGIIYFLAKTSPKNYQKILDKTPLEKLAEGIVINLHPDVVAKGETSLGVTLVHEGSHVGDLVRLIEGHLNGTFDGPTHYETEKTAFIEGNKYLDSLNLSPQEKITFGYVSDIDAHLYNNYHGLSDTNPGMALSEELDLAVETLRRDIEEEEKKKKKKKQGN